MGFERLSHRLTFVSHCPEYRRHLLCRHLSLFGERFHFGSDDGEATSFFSSSGRLDGCVEREQVRLSGDPTDERDDLGGRL